MRKYVLGFIAALATVAGIGAAVAQISGGNVFRNLRVTNVATINDLQVTSCTGCSGGGGTAIARGNGIPSGGDIISAVGFSGLVVDDVGEYTLTFTADYWAGEEPSAPYCTITSHQAVTGGFFTIASISDTTMVINSFNAAGAPATINFDVICVDSGT
jgi:hypothetical protein